MDPHPMVAVYQQWKRKIKNKKKLCHRKGAQSL
jgi:hypothetical protein